MVEGDAFLCAILLDALDRLYDQESRVIDIYALLEASRVALSSSELAEVLSDAAEALGVLIRLGRSEVELNRAALVVTDPLRQSLAALYQPMTLLSHDPVRGRAVAARLLRDVAAETRKFGRGDGAAFFEAVADELSREPPTRAC